MDEALTLWQHIERIFFLKGEVAFNAPLWFLIVMFYIAQISEIMELAKYPMQKKILVAICSFVGRYLLYTLGVYLPLGWDKLLVCFGFYCLGSAASHFKLKKRWIAVFIAALSSVIWVLAGVICNEKVSVYAFSFGNYWLFICSGIFGSVLWFGLSYRLRRSRFFSYLGQNTILIVGTQYFGIFIVRYATRLVGVEGTMTYNILSLAITYAALILYVPVSKVIDAYFPWMVGKRRAYANNITPYYQSKEDT